MIRNEFNGRKSIRLKGYDYSNPWWYYVTICVKEHRYFLGKVNKDKVELSSCGLIAKQFWEEIPKHFPDTEIDYFVVMPNHIHGIIIINESRDVIYNVPTKENYFSNISPNKRSLSVIIRTFKAAVTRECHKNGNKEFQWQRNYYDRIIRNEKELFHIRKYILQNPLKWEFEKQFPINIEL